MDLPSPPAHRPAARRHWRSSRHQRPAGWRRPIASHFAKPRTGRCASSRKSTRSATASPRSHLGAVQAARIGRQGFVLSVVAAIFLPLGVPTGFFGVNLGDMPGTDVPWAFGAFVAASLALVFLLYLLFRWLRWF